MSSQHHACDDDMVKLTIQLSEEERTFIKLLATKKRMTISEFVMSFIRPSIPSRRKPNAETKRALKEIEENKNLERYKTVKDFWKAMEIDPDA